MQRKIRQNTKWFAGPLDEKILKLLVDDVWAVHKLLKFVQDLGSLSFKNSWTGETHFYFATSYRLDQMLMPMFLEISLQGVSVSTENLEKARVENNQLLRENLEELEITLDIFRSSQKFTALEPQQGF